MALIAISVDDHEQYVSIYDPARKEVPVLDEKGEKTGEVKIDIDMETATIFELAPLDVRMNARINDSTMQVTQMSGVSMQLNAANVEIVKHGLKGWKNFTDKDGKAVPFLTEKLPVGSTTYTVVSDQSLTRLGTQLLKELASRIKDLTQVSPNAAKN